MPRGNGTGPAGMGPMTGRGAGFCAGFNTPGYMNRTVGGGMGMGFGRGRGMGNGFGWRQQAAWAPNYAPAAYAPVAPSPQQEMDMLKNQAAALSQQMDAIQDRLDQLSSQTEDKK